MMAVMIFMLAVMIFFPILGSIECSYYSPLKPFAQHGEEKEEGPQVFTHGEEKRRGPLESLHALGSRIVLHVKDIAKDISRGPAPSATTTTQKFPLGMLCPPRFRGVVCHGFELR